MRRNTEEEKTIPLEQQKEQPTIIEREITLSLINEKLNYIISKLNENVED